MEHVTEASTVTPSSLEDVRVLNDSPGHSGSVSSSVASALVGGIITVLYNNNSTFICLQKKRYKYYKRAPSWCEIWTPDLCGFIGIPHQPYDIKDGWGNLPDQECFWSTNTRLPPVKQKIESAMLVNIHVIHIQVESTTEHNGLTQIRSSHSLTNIVFLQSLQALVWMDHIVGSSREG